MANNNYNSEQRIERYRSLPENMKAAIGSIDNIAVIKYVGEKYHLHIDQIGKLSDQIGLVILGLEPSTNFVKNIEESSKIDHQTAENIAREINEQIFLKIRESLKQMEENKNTPKPEDLLKEINATPNIFEQKLGGSVNIRPIDNSLTINPDTPSTLPPRGPSVHFDPYHEPTN